MISPNEFWLYVHRLLVAHDAEGLTPEERTANIVEQLQEMSPIAQRELLRELRVVADNTSDLYLLAVAAFGDESSGRQAPARVGCD